MLHRLGYTLSYDELIRYKQSIVQCDSVDNLPLYPFVTLSLWPIMSITTYVLLMARILPWHGDYCSVSTVPDG